MATVTIIGAGLSGLTAAHLLRDAGHEVTLYDKGRGVGGRLATRRIGAARLDHGAQFFTVRGEAFSEVVAGAVADGAVAEWCRGFGEVDGYPRYRGADGMTSFAKYLARDHDIRLGTRIEDLREVAADAMLVTAPIPQALALLEASAMAPPATLGRQLAEVTYNRTIAAMYVLDEPSPLEDPGALQAPDGPVLTFVADNMLKGVSTVPAVTMHASNAWSIDHWELDADELACLLAAEASTVFGSFPAAYEAQVHKWLYAGPQNPWPEPFCVAGEDPLVVLAGDSFRGPKVEGAFNSGFAAGTELVERLG